MGKINSILIWDVEIFIEYFCKACIESISDVLVNDDDGEDGDY
jgi:hypothetical protein